MKPICIVIFLPPIVIKKYNNLNPYWSRLAGCSLWSNPLLLANFDYCESVLENAKENELSTKCKYIFRGYIYNILKMITLHTILQTLTF